MGAKPIPSAKIGTVPLTTPDRQWTQCSLRLPVGTLPTLIAGERDAHFDY